MNAESLREERDDSFRARSRTDRRPGGSGNQSVKNFGKY